ncbi:hypothetical protein [Henriciella marina]|uniref:Uncharacterized protein n=1 Tax=Henriciella marina TaxID=453851 RepID=A0ABT4LTQ9_9PROT|nr:hypothetical protein [Henriciella marina]MCZ4297760.1 hypothetical protein [Henriciella marina]
MDADSCSIVGAVPGAAVVVRSHDANITQKVTARNIRENMGLWPFSLEGCGIIVQKHGRAFLFDVQVKPVEFHHSRSVALIFQVYHKADNRQPCFREMGQIEACACEHE